MRILAAITVLAGLVLVVLLNLDLIETTAPVSTSSPVTSESKVVAPDAAAILPDLGDEVTIPDLSALQVGDTVTIHVPEEQRTLRGQVTRVEVTTAGNRVVHGRLRDDETERDYPFVFTQGTHLKFGTLQTGRNRYQIEVRNDVGRMIAATSLGKTIDYSQPDFVLPERIKEPEKPAGQD